MIGMVAGFGGALVAGLSLMLWISETRLDKANITITELKTEKSVWIAELAECKVADFDNQKAIKECKKVNEDNARDAAKVATGVAVAVDNSKARDDEIERRVAEIRNQEREHDEDCRTMDEPLPEFAIARLRRDHP